MHDNGISPAPEPFFQKKGLRLMAFAARATFPAESNIDEIVSFISKARLIRNLPERGSQVLSFSFILVSFHPPVANRVEPKGGFDSMHQHFGSHAIQNAWEVLYDPFSDEHKH